MGANGAKVIWYSSESDVRFPIKIGIEECPDRPKEALSIIERCAHDFFQRNKWDRLARRWPREFSLYKSGDPDVRAVATFTVEFDLRPEFIAYLHQPVAYDGTGKS